jgi:hypothetical protein
MARRDARAAGPGCSGGVTAPDRSRVTAPDRNRVTAPDRNPVTAH